MFKQFSAFIMRGNVIDLAVGVIIGAAFGKIVDSLVNKLIMPVIGIALGDINFEKAVLTVGKVELGWGEVVQNIVQFVIIGMVLFLILKAYNKATNKKDVNYAPAPSPTEQLLADIKGIMARIDEKTK
jgi:large conductance mechanosensitive channel